MPKDDEEDDKRTKLEGTRQFKIIVYKLPQTIDVIYENNRGSIGMESSHLLSMIH